MAKGIAHFGILFLFIIYSGHASAILVSDLLISEVMANPSALPDARGEWFELYNPTDHEINLRDTWIGDDDNDHHKIETDLLILPTQYLTLARSVEPGFTPDYVYDDFTLGNGADEIVFSDGMMELLRLDYSADFVEAGRSSELTALPMLASNYGLTLESLIYGAGDIGTPGSAGSLSFTAAAVPLPATFWLFITGILAISSTTLMQRPNTSSRKPALPSPQPLSSSPAFLLSFPRFLSLPPQFLQLSAGILTSFSRFLPLSARPLPSSRYAGPPRKRRSGVPGSYNGSPIYLQGIQQS